MALCFPEQVYLSETLCTHLDDRATGNTHLWLSTFCILSLSPIFFSHTFLLKQDDSAADSMPGHYLKPEGSEPSWSRTKCSRVEKQAKENTIWVLCHCSFSLALTVPAIFIFFFLSCFRYKSL